MMIQALVIGLIATTYQACDTPPVITLNGYAIVTVRCNEPYIELGARAWSACYGDLTQRVTVSNSSVNTSVPGEYMVVYSVTDNDNITVTTTRTVRILDNFSLSLKGVEYVDNVPGYGEVNVTYWECNKPYDDPGAEAWDDCDGDLTRNIVVEHAEDVLTGQINYDDPYANMYLVTYTVKNSRNDVLTAMRLVIVQDIQEPVIAMYGLGEAPVNVLPSTAPDPLWWQDCLAAYRARYPNPKYRLPSSWRIKEEFIKDIEPYYWHCDKPSYEDPGAAAFDFCEGPLDPDDILLIITHYMVKGNVELFRYVGYMGDFDIYPPPRLYEDLDRSDFLGYRAYYLIKDRSGNPFFHSALRTLRSRLIDPTYRIGFQGVGGTTLVECHDPFDPRANVIAYDMCEGDITPRMVITGQVNTDIPGIYQLRYDALNNYGTWWFTGRLVQVVDREGPIIQMLDSENVPVLSPTTIIPWCSLRDNGVSWWEDDTGWFALRPEKGWKVTDRCDDNAVLTSRVSLYGVGELREALEFLAAPRDQGVDPEPYLKDYIIRHNVQDNSKNPALPGWRTVRVVPTTPEIIINSSESLTVECGQPFTDPFIKILDVARNDKGEIISECSTDPAVDPLLLRVGGDAIPDGQGGYTIDVDVPGTYKITYLVVNALGNQDYAERQVQVTDDAAPVITFTPVGGNVLEPQLNWPPGVPFVPAQILIADAQDSCDGVVSVNITDRGGMDFSGPARGRYVIGFSAMDRAGNIGRKNLIVCVECDPVVEGEEEGETAPTLRVQLLGSATMTLECGVPYKEPGAKVVDVDGSEVPGISVILPAPPDIWVSGTHTLVYDKTTTGVPIIPASRTITAIDTAAPVITLKGEPTITLNMGQTFVDPGATALDACDNVLKPTIEGTVDTNVLGTYTLIYTAVDRAGNKAAPLTRNVKVVDPKAGDEGEPASVEGEAAKEGEAGEGEEAPPDSSGCFSCMGCSNSNKSLNEQLPRVLGDYLLVGATLLALAFWTQKRKEM